MDKLSFRVAARFMNAALVKRVASRYVEAMEFPTPEARKNYLKDHPRADPSNHTVRKPKKDKPKKEEPGSGGAKKTFFDSAEVEKLPLVRQQPIKDPEKLFQQAEEAHKQQLKWLNQGKGLDKAIGATVVRADKGDDFTKAWTAKGPVVLIGPMKKKDRAEEKVKSDYGGDWSMLTDAVRASVAVDSLDELHNVMDQLKKSGLKLAKKPKDRFANPTEAGYRDILMNVEYPNGHVGELQLHVKPMLKAKEEGHKLYDVIRKIEAKAKEDGREKLTAEEQKIIDETNTKSKALYDKAWEEATGSKSVDKTKNAATMHVGAKKYYDYDGAPAYWETRNFPKAVHIKGESTIWGLYDFFMHATPIQEHEFEAMKKALKKNSN